MTSPREKYEAARRMAGADPLECGLIGKLADNECPHGRLPNDRTKRCGCWREEGAVLKVINDNKTAHGYPATAAAAARRYRDAGFSLAEIQDLIQREHGRRPGRDTVMSWTDEDYRQRRLQRIGRKAAASSAASATFRLRSSSVAYQAAFVRRLRQEGVTWENVARCCNVVFGGRFSSERVHKLAEMEEAA